MYRRMASMELAKLFNLISHFERILIIEELAQGELDVTGLQARLKLSQPATSRHLSLLKAYNLVHERKEGRHVFYRLTVPELSQWLIAGLDILEKKVSQDRPVSETFTAARKLWATPPQQGDPKAPGAGGSGTEGT